MTTTVGTRTRNLAPYLLSPPALRRPDATVSFPVFQPARVAVPLTRPEPTPEPARPRGYRGTRRARTDHPMLSVLLLGMGLGVVLATALGAAAITALMVLS